MDRDELHERVMLLKEEIEAGRVKFREGLNVIDSLQKVRFAADGKVDPDTVDGVVRSLALPVEYGRYRRETKKVPLKEAQSKYFEILEKFFGGPFAEMKKHVVTPPQLAEHLASRPGIVKAFTADAEEFFAAMKEFWAFYGPVVEAHLQDAQTLKSVFGGDIFPSYEANIAASVGLYVDTVVLPDPLLRAASLVGFMKPERVLFFTTKHALNALQYKDLALAEVSPPIVVIAPDASYIEEPYRPVLQMAGEADLMAHLGRLFGHRFTDLAEAEKFLSSITDAKSLVRSLSEPERLLFDTEWSGSLEEQIQRYVREFGGHFAENWDGRPIGEVIRLSLLGRMMQANDIVFKAYTLRGNPLVDAPTSWQYLLWKYEYDSMRRTGRDGNLRDTLISKVILEEGTARVGLLSGLPSDALIELRRKGAMAELRELMRKGIHAVDSASDSSLAEVGEVVVTNLCNAFAEHRSQLTSLASERRKFYGLDVSRWLAVGGVSIAAAATGNVGLGVLAACLAMSGSPSPDELRRRWKDLDHRGDQLRRSPVGILFHHTNRN